MAASWTSAADSLIERLLRIAGLTAAPAQMRGPDESADTGSIWIADLERGTTTQLTSDAGYRSPIFAPTDGSIYALLGDTVVRISSDGGTPTPLHRLPGAVKLVGFDGVSAQEIVALFDGGASPLAVLSLKTGSVVRLPYDPTSVQQQRMLAQIRGHDRVYGTISVYVKSENKRGLARTIEWTDVYVRRGDAAPQNVSGCDGVSCGQPALSPDGRRVVFVKAGG
jgi:hypothetical protein